MSLWSSSNGGGGGGSGGGGGGSSNGGGGSSNGGRTNGGGSNSGGGGNANNINFPSASQLWDPAMMQQIAREVEQEIRTLELFRVEHQRWNFAAGHWNQQRQAEVRLLLQRVQDSERELRQTETRMLSSEASRELRDWLLWRFIDERLGLPQPQRPSSLPPHLMARQTEMANQTEDLWESLMWLREAILRRPPPRFARNWPDWEHRRGATALARQLDVMAEQLDAMWQPNGWLQQQTRGQLSELPSQRNFTGHQEELDVMLRQNRWEWRVFGRPGEPQQQPPDMRQLRRLDRRDAEQRRLPQHLRQLREGSAPAPAPSNVPRSPGSIARRRVAESCAICHEGYAPGEEMAFGAGCSHYFHGPCIDRWLRGGHTTCPVCRAQFSGAARP
jgi:hypothetical protein